jgi:lipoprotein signal peptidase
MKKHYKIWFTITILIIIGILLYFITTHKTNLANTEDSMIWEVDEVYKDWVIITR